MKKNVYFVVAVIIGFLDVIVTCQKNVVAIILEIKFKTIIFF